MMQQRVLVTGATGFIGKFFIPYLIEKNNIIRVVVRNKNPDFFPGKIIQHQGDLTDASSLINVADNIDIVFHLGGYAHAWKEKGTSSQKHHQVNFLGVKNMMQECIRAKVKKFIFFSTIKAVGDSTECIDEAWNTLPNTPYGLAKRTAEDWILKMGKENNIDVCILRLALVYGKELKGNLYHMLRAIDKGYFFPIPPVKNKRSLVNVYDVCQAAWLAAQSNNSNGKIFFVSDQKIYSTYDIYLVMRQALGKKIPRYAIPLWIFQGIAKMGDKLEKLFFFRFPFTEQTFQKLFGSSFCSSLLIQKELGFSSSYSLEDLMPSIVQAYTTHTPKCDF